MASYITISNSNNTMTNTPTPTNIDICEDHQRNLEILCADCNQLICVECSISIESAHRFHNLTMISNIISEERKIIESIIVNSERVRDKQEKKLSKLIEDNLGNNDALSECDNKTRIDSLLMSRYIKSDAMKCLVHDINSDVICSDCRECVCLKCLIDHENIHRKHIVKTKDEIIVSIKEDLTDKINGTNKRINKCNLAISLARDIICKQEELLTHSDKDIINNYVAHRQTNFVAEDRVGVAALVSVLPSLPTYADNKIAIREFLRKKQFEKLLDYAEYDLKCMIRRTIYGKNFILYILTYCTDYAIICHFIDNIVDINFDINSIHHKSCMYTYSNIFQYVYWCSTMEIIKYVAEKITIPDNIWTMARRDKDADTGTSTFVSFFEFISIDLMVSIINRIANPVDNALINAVFCNRHYSKTTFDKICYIIDNVMNLNELNNYASYIIRYSGSHVLKYIIDQGIDLEEEDATLCDQNQNRCGNEMEMGEGTPIFTAIYCKNVEAVKLLIGAGANLEHENSCGNRPIHLAIYSKNISIIKLLVDAGVNLNCKNAKGCTPLQLIQEFKLNQNIISAIKD